VTRRARIHGAGHDTDIAHASATKADDLVGKTLFQVDAHLRVAREKGAQGFGQEFRERVGVGEDADLPAKPPAKAPRSSRRRSAWASSARACWSSVRPAGVGTTPWRLRTRRGSAERLLHVADAGAGGGERQVRPLGPMGDAARIDHMAEQAEVGEVELHGAYRDWTRREPNCMDPTATGSG
jgi:hypothetical protein